MIEHLDPWRLDALAAVVFGDARPGTVVVTSCVFGGALRYPERERVSVPAVEVHHGAGPALRRGPTERPGRARHR